MSTLPDTIADDQPDLDSYTPADVQIYDESPEAFFSRLAQQDLAERVRIEATYPLLIETLVPRLPRSHAELAGAVAAFLRSLGLEPDQQGESVGVCFLGRLVRIGIEDVEQRFECVGDMTDRDVEAGGVAIG